MRARSCEVGIPTDYDMSRYYDYEDLEPGVNKRALLHIAEAELKMTDGLHQMAHHY